ncbi:MAG: FAD-dependent monooxygenase [Polyangiaceae bacterium]
METASAHHSQWLAHEIESESNLASAIVIGGGMAGLLAARVLTERFDRVWVVDRDHFEADARIRAGVPQARHAHALLAGGRNVVNELFPGLEADLISKGAMPVDWGADFAIHTAAGWMPRASTGVISFGCSRALLESSIRARLMKDPRVRFIEGCDVSGLIVDDEKRVSGVRLRKRDSSTKKNIERAELVVDASGRSSHAPKWLVDLGYSLVEETTIDSCRAYASRWYEQPSGSRGWKAMLHATWAPNETRGGLIYPVEDDRWCVTLSGAGLDYPPTDDAGFLDFARRQPTPLIYEAIRDARPVSPIHGFRRLENRRRHFERMKNWPAGFIVIGDAMCAFNPVFAQGMSVSALGAMTLRRCLRAHDPRDPRFGRSFQRALARTNAAPWFMTTTEDLRWSVTEGAPCTWKHRLAQRYLDHVSGLASESPRINRLNLEVWHLVKPPWMLLNPMMAVEPLRRRIRQATSQMM